VLSDLLSRRTGAMLSPFVWRYFSAFEKNFGQGIVLTLTMSYIEMSEKINFSEHACDRIEERGADYEFVRKVVSGEEYGVRRRASRPDRIILVARDNKNVIWSIISDIECSAVITVRKANKTERKDYAKKSKDYRGTEKRI
jgi:uncharacterized DUF497 family protein